MYQRLNLVFGCECVEVICIKDEFWSLDGSVCIGGLTCRSLQHSKFEFLSFSEIKLINIHTKSIEPNAFDAHTQPLSHMTYQATYITG